MGNELFLSAVDSGDADPGLSADYGTPAKATPTVTPKG